MNRVTSIGSQFLIFFSRKIKSTLSESASSVEGGGCDDLRRF